MKLKYFHGSPGIDEESEELKNELKPDHELIVVNSDSHIDVAIGYSWGCIEALKYSQSTQRNLKGLILISPYVLPKKTLITHILDIPLLSDLLLGIFSKKAINSFISKSATPETPTEYYKSLRSKFSDLAIVKNSIKEKAQISKEEIHKLINNNSLPTLIIYAKTDLISNFKTNISVFKKENITQAIIEDAGHALPLQRPKEVSKYIITFLKKI